MAKSINLDIINIEYSLKKCFVKTMFLLTPFSRYSCSKVAQGANSLIRGEIFKNGFLTEHLRATAFGSSNPRIPFNAIMYLKNPID